MTTIDNRVTHTSAWQRNLEETALLVAGLGGAFGLFAFSLWAVRPSETLGAWSGAAAPWCAAAAALLVVAHLAVAWLWSRPSGRLARLIDPRAGLVCALATAPGFALSAATLVAAVSGLVGGPAHPNHVADDADLPTHVLRLVIAGVVSVAVVLVVRATSTLRRPNA